MKEFFKAISSKIVSFFTKPHKQGSGQTYINNSRNSIKNSPNATIDNSVQFGANIQVSKDPPKDQKEGDLWLKILDNDNKGSGK